MENGSSLKLLQSNIAIQYQSGSWILRLNHAPMMCSNPKISQLNSKYLLHIQSIGITHHQQSNYHRAMSVFFKKITSICGGKNSAELEKLISKKIRIGSHAQIWGTANQMPTSTSSKSMSFCFCTKTRHIHESTISSWISFGAISPGIESIRCRSLSLWAAASSA